MITEAIQEISPKELKLMFDQQEDISLIDVRELFEKELVSIGGELIPLATIPQNVQKIPRDKKVIVICRSGKRSGDAILYLQREYGFENLFNLQGGILRWIDDVDNSLKKY